MEMEAENSCVNGGDRNSQGEGADISVDENSCRNDNSQGDEAENGVDQNSCEDQGPTEYDVAAAAAGAVIPSKWSQVASLTTDGASVNALEMTMKKSVEIADVEMNPGAVTTPKEKGSVKSWKTTLKSIPVPVWEALVLTPVLLIIIGLFTLPTVFYALPSKQPLTTDVTDVTTPQQVDVGNKTESDCTNVTAYSGEVCREVFSSLQTCFSGEMSPPPALNIPSLVDQEAGERDAMNLVNGLSLLNPSPQCREAIIPFLCLYIFTLCDPSNDLHTTSRDDCLELRDNICAEEWSQAVGFLDPGVLPVCEDLPDITDECIGNRQLLSPTPDNNSTSALQCSEGFFFDENSTNICRPTCGEYNALPLGEDIVKRIAVVVCCIASVIMFVLALTKQRETLLVFPTVIFVYICISTFIASSVIMIGFFDNFALFCGSKDLLTATEKGKETPFCTLTGFIFNYSLEQIPLWGTIHAIFLLWAVMDPLGFRQFKKLGKLRYAHIISVILAVVVPLIGPCVLLRDGYVVTSFPSLACVGRNLDVTYYTIILPASLIVATTSCLLLLFFWTIFKELVLKKILRGKKVRVLMVGKVQLKIACMIIYYTLVGVMGLVIFTFNEANAGNQDSHRDYILCESGGRSDCVLDLGINSNVNSAITTIIYVMISFLPVLAIFFSFNPQTCTGSRGRERSTSARSTFLSKRSSTKSSIYRPN